MILVMDQEGTNTCWLQNSKLFISFHRAELLCIHQWFVIALFHRNVSLSLSKKKRNSFKSQQLRTHTHISALEGPYKCFCMFHLLNLTYTLHFICVCFNLLVFFWHSCRWAQRAPYLLWLIILLRSLSCHQAATKILLSALTDDIYLEHVSSACKLLLFFISRQPLCEAGRTHYRL